MTAHEAAARSVQMLEPVSASYMLDEVQAERIGLHQGNVFALRHVEIAVDLPTGEFHLEHALGRVVTDTAQGLGFDGLPFHAPTLFERTDGIV